jgi:hypothetical protein
MLTLTKVKKTIEALEKKAEIEVKFNGTLAKNHDDLNCQIKIDEIATSFTLKAHHPFETSEKKNFIIPRKTLYGDDKDWSSQSFFNN